MRTELKAVSVRNVRIGRPLMYGSIGGIVLAEVGEWSTENG